MLGHYERAKGWDETGNPFEASWAKAPTCQPTEQCFDDTGNSVGALALRDIPPCPDGSNLENMARCPAAMRGTTYA
jgi:hypothetical protein